MWFFLFSSLRSHDEARGHHDYIATIPRKTNAGPKQYAVFVVTETGVSTAVQGRSGNSTHYAAGAAASVWRFEIHVDTTVFAGSPEGWSSTRPSVRRTYDITLTAVQCHTVTENRWTTVYYDVINGFVRYYFYANDT